jgi:hypothetical protein
MFSDGQCLRYPKLFYGFGESCGGIFVVLVAGGSAIKVIGQYLAAGGKRWVKIVLPVFFPVLLYMLCYLVGNYIPCRHKSPRRLYRQVFDHIKLYLLFIKFNIDIFWYSIAVIKLFYLMREVKHRIGKRHKIIGIAYILQLHYGYAREDTNGIQIFQFGRILQSASSAPGLLRSAAWGCLPATYHLWFLVFFLS